jgi:hypothetical protein
MWKAYEINLDASLVISNYKGKGESIPVTGREGSYG